MKVKFYRLGERKIIEADNGALWWEAHSGLGALRRGKCSIKENILLIGPGESVEPGFLKREFLDRLQEFPQWESTGYFCSGYSIHECQTCRKLTEKEIAGWAGNRTHPMRNVELPQRPLGKETSSEGPDPATLVSYKLGQYEIKKKTDGQVWWKTYSGCGSLREGRCIIAGEILFLGAAESEEPNHLKQSFFEHLSQLLQWRATRYYCTSCVLYDCRTGENLVEEEGSELPGEALRPSTKESFTPPGRTSPSHPPFPKPWRPRLYESSISFQKRIVGKTDSGAEREPYGARLKSKGFLKSRFIQSGIASLKSLMGEYPIKRWIAHIGALMLMIGDRALALFPGNRKNKDGHHNHGEQSSKHHRGD
jgi:hypothetical protein